MIKRFHSSLFFIRDIERTTDFYKNVGFEVEGETTTLRIVLGDFRLTFMLDGTDEIGVDIEGKERGTGVFTYVEVEDVDEHYKSLLSKGILTSSEPHSWPWGKREYTVKDPDGYTLVFFSSLK